LAAAVLAAALTTTAPAAMTPESRVSFVRA
jgi:hypothetical protein